MISTINRIYMFRMFNATFADEPYDIEGYDRSYFTWCRKDDESINADGFIKAKRYYSTIDLTKPLQEIRDSFNDTTRNLLNHADWLKMNDQWACEINKDYEEFLELMNKFAKAKKMWYKNIRMEDLEGLKNRYLVMLYEDPKGNRKLLEAGLFAMDKGSIHAQFMCSRRVLANQPNYDDKYKATARYVYWKAMQYGKSRGAKELYLALGPDIENPSPLARFKMSFNGRIASKYMYVKNYNPILKAMERLNIWKA